MDAFSACIVIFGGQCAHRIELTGHFPAQLAAASKKRCPVCPVDLFNRITDTKVEVAQAELME